MKKILSSEYGKMKLEVPFIIKKGRTGFVAECLDLSIVTQGANLRETRKNMSEAVKLHLKSANDLGILENELKIGNC